MNHRHHIQRVGMTFSGHVGGDEGGVIRYEALTVPASPPLVEVSAVYAVQAVNNGHRGRRGGTVVQHTRHCTTSSDIQRY